MRAQTERTSCSSSLILSEGYNTGTRTHAYMQTHTHTHTHTHFTAVLRCGCWHWPRLPDLWRGIERLDYLVCVCVCGCACVCVHSSHSL